jgi:O-antigen/teichoic acid export membrane protein
MSEHSGPVPPWPADPFPARIELVGPTVWPYDPFETTEVPEPPRRRRPAPSSGRRRGDGRSDLGLLARGGALNFASVIVSAVLGLILVPIVTRGLGPSTAGLFFEAIALFLIISNTAELGADAGLLRLIPRYRALHRTQDVRPLFHIGLWPALVGGLLLAWVMYAFAPQLADLFFETNKATDPRAVGLIRILAVFVPISGISTVLVSASRGFGAMLPTVAIENVGKPLFRVLLAFAVVVLGLRVAALGIGWGIPIVVGLIVVYRWDKTYLKRAERRDRYDRRDRRSVGELAAEFWRFSAPRGLVGTLSTTQSWIDTLIVGGLIGTAQAAIYTVSTRVLAVSLFVIGSINLVIAPQISSLLSLGEKERAKNVYQTATDWIILSSWPPTLALITFAPLVLSLFGPQYVQGQHVLTVLGLAAMLYLSTGPLITVLVMGGKSGWSLFNQILSLSTNIALNLVLIPRWGITGAGVAWALTGVVGQGSALIEVALFLKLSPYHRVGLLAALGSAIVYGLGGVFVRVLFGATLPAFVIYLVVATAVYILFLWRFRRTFRLGELRRALPRPGGERSATLQPT